RRRLANQLADRVFPLGAVETNSYRAQCLVDHNLKLTYQVVEKYSDTCEMLLEVIHTLVVNTKRYLVYERLHKDSALVRKVLQDFYFDVVEFCAMSVKHYRRRSIGIHKYPRDLRCPADE